MSLRDRYKNFANKHKHHHDSEQATPRIFASAYTVPKTDEKEAEIGLLGAGITSLYAAMILETLGLKYTILEGQDRYGGRLFTHRMGGSAPGSMEYFDVGAMRYPELDSMKRVTDFLKNRLHLDLQTYHLSSDNQVSYFNGVLARNSDPNSGQTIDNTFTNVDPSLIAQGSGALLDKLLTYNHSTGNKITGSDDDIMYLQQYDAYSTRAFIIHLRETNPDFKLWNDECIAWLETMDTGTGLFDRAYSESVIDYLDFSGDVHWNCISGGSEMMVEAAVSHINKERIILNQKVVRLSHNEEGVQVGVVDQTLGRENEFTFKDVVCTLPLGPLRNVDTTNIDFDLYQRTGFRSLAYDISVKVGLAFHSRWWEKDPWNIHGGSDSTDLPSRTIVYPSNGIGDSARAFIIASYTWSQDALRFGSMTHDERVNQTIRDMEIIFRKRAEAFGVEYNGEVQSQLIREECYSHAWQNDKWIQGAFALYGPGQFSTYYEPSITAVADGRLHFGGEALSHNHAWVNGSIISAYRSVGEILDRRGDTARKQQLEELWGESSFDKKEE